MMGINPENLSAEERLLVGLCGSVGEGNHPSLKLRLAKQGAQSGEQGAQGKGERIDWERFLWLANEHGVIALAGYNLGVIGTGHRAQGSEHGAPSFAEATDGKAGGAKEEETESSFVPEGVRRVLENGLMQSVVRNAWLAERWKEVNRILCEAGIRHILLKGMALEHTIYGSRGLRQMNDNDILLKKEDCMRAWNLLQENGFTTEPVKSGLHRKILLDIGKHLPSLYKDGYSVEIHHRLFNESPDKGKEPTDYFADSEEINVGETKALILSKKTQLEHLVSHYHKHAEEGNCQLRLYADILLLDDTIDLDFPEHFIGNPKQGMGLAQRKASYKSVIKSIPAGSRLRYIIGDTFPSIEWMRKRHGCGGLKALLFYPRRIGKVSWIF